MLIKKPLYLIFWLIFLNIVMPKIKMELIDLATGGGLLSLSFSAMD